MPKISPVRQFLTYYPHPSIAFNTFQLVRFPTTLPHGNLAAFTDTFVVTIAKKGMQLVSRMLPKCYYAQNSSHTHRVKNDAIQSVNNVKGEKPWYILIKSLLSEFITDCCPSLNTNFLISPLLIQIKLPY